MRTEIAAFAASILLNTAVFGVLDRVALDEGTALGLQKQASRRSALKRDSAGTQFDFVEVPPIVSLREALKTKKIAAHDSVAQDASRAQDAPREAGPKIEKQGPADQLEQRRSESISSRGSPASAPSLPRPPSRPSQDEAAPQTPTTPASPASMPSPSIQGRSTRDKIDTPVVSRAHSHGAQVYGATSFDATGSGMGKYMKNLKERIWLAWFPYLSFHYPKDFKTADAVIQFTLDAQGQVRSVQVVSVEGSPVFAAFCMEAVQRASPFGPVPAEVLDLIGRDELDVQFAFHFW